MRSGGLVLEGSKVDAGGLNPGKTRAGLGEGAIGATPGADCGISMAILDLFEIPTLPAASWALFV